MLMLVQSCGLPAVAFAPDMVVEQPDEAIAGLDSGWLFGIALFGFVTLMLVWRHRRSKRRGPLR